MKTKRELELEVEVAKLAAQVEMLKEMVMSGVGQVSVNPASFTAKQHVVLQGLHEGLSNEEIAERMDASVGTVKGHMYSIMNHLGVRRRDQVLDMTMAMMKMDPEDYGRLAGVGRDWIYKRRHRKDDPVLTKKGGGEDAQGETGR